MPTSRRKYRIQYYKENAITKSVQFNINTDADIIDTIYDVNFQGYVKHLIRQDMRKKNRQIDKFKICEDDD